MTTSVLASSTPLLAVAASALALCFGAALSVQVDREGRRSALERRARRIARGRSLSAGRRPLTGALGLAERLGGAGDGRRPSARDAPLAPGARSYLADKVRLAGAEGRVAGAGIARASLRLACAGAVAGLMAGLCLSEELGVALAVVGGALGLTQCLRELSALRRLRNGRLSRDLPEMLEVVGLGLRSGLTFDKSLGLYALRFSTAFAEDCGRAMDVWASGLASREEALRTLASSYDSPLLERTVRAVVRSLRLGTPLSPVVEAAAQEARAERRAALEEQVAKAPVKMMLPTAALMLPAMLVMVLGPVLLQMMGGA